MSGFIVYIIQSVSTLLVIVIIVDVLLSYFLSPYHPVKSALDKVVDPMLNPIRKVLPRSPLDFSPVLLIIIIQVVEYLLINLAIRLG